MSAAAVLRRILNSGHAISLPLRWEAEAAIAEDADMLAALELVQSCRLAPTDKHPGSFSLAGLSKAWPAINAALAKARGEA